MSKKNNKNTIYEAYSFINEYDSYVEARVICTYLNKLSKHMKDLYFMIPNRNLYAISSQAYEIVAIGKVSGIKERDWYSISEAFFEGLQYEL